MVYYIAEKYGNAEYKIYNINSNGVEELGAYAINYEYFKTYYKELIGVDFNEEVLTKVGDSFVHRGDNLFGNVLIDVKTNYNLKAESFIQDKNTYYFTVLVNEVGVNNLVVNIGFEKTGDFLEIPLMRFASPISIMYQTDSDGNYLFQELIDFWKTLPKEENTYNKCRELIKKFDGVDKYKYIIEEFKFYTLPNSNYFSISELDSEWLPAKDLTNLGPQVVTNAGNVYYNEPGFEFSNDDDNSWVGISKFRDSYKDVMQISSVKMLTSEEIQGVDVSGYINIGYPFILTKLGKSYDQGLMDEQLLEEFLLDIKEGRSSNIRVVYLAKPKIPLNSYLDKVHSFIFNKCTKTDFGNIFTYNNCILNKGDVYVQFIYLVA